LDIVKTQLPNLLIINPIKINDNRGYLAETYHADKYRDAGIDTCFAQDNQSYSLKGVLRGLHAQVKKPQAKLVRALVGEIYDVAVDARPGSPTFGKWHGDYLSGENLKQLYIPAGFLHGFCVLSDSALIHYKCSEVYDPTDNFGVKWDDPELAVEWPIKSPVVSPKDAQNMSWAEAQKILKTS